MTRRCWIGRATPISRWTSLRLSHQSATVSGGAGLFPQAPAADADRVGKNDKIFPADGAYPYKRDLPDVEFHLLDTGHFALEDKLDTMAPMIREFLDRKVATP